MRLHLPVDSTAEDGFCALVDVDSTLLATILERRRAFEAARAALADLDQMVYSDTDVEWFDQLTEHDKQVQDELPAHEPSEVPAAFGTVVDAARTDMDAMVVTQAGVRWRAFLKYTEIVLETCNIRWEWLDQHMGKRS